MSRGLRTGQGSTLPAPAVVGLRPIAYTPTVTWTGSTIGSPTGFYLKEPGKLTLFVSFAVSVAGAGATLTISTPSGYVASMTTNVGPTNSSLGLNAYVNVTAGAFTTVASPNSPTPGVATWSGVLVIPTTA